MGTYVCNGFENVRARFRTVLLVKTRPSPPVSSGRKTRASFPVFSPARFAVRNSRTSPPGRNATRVDSEFRIAFEWRRTKTYYYRFSLFHPRSSDLLFRFTRNTYKCCEIIEKFYKKTLPELNFKIF